MVKVPASKKLTVTKPEKTILLRDELEAAHSHFAYYDEKAKEAKQEYKDAKDEMKKLKLKQDMENVFAIRNAAERKLLSTVKKFVVYSKEEVKNDGR